MLTVIFDEPIHTITGTPTLDLSVGELGAYLSNAEYVDAGTGTNTLIFKATANRDLTADDVQELNKLLLFKENGGGTFAAKIGKIIATVADYKGATNKLK